jgi:hypothetical protein
MFRNCSELMKKFRMLSEKKVRNALFAIPPDR